MLIPPPLDRYCISQLRWAHCWLGLIFHTVLRSQDKSLIVMVAANGEASITPLLDATIANFWRQMAAHPKALATAGRCIPGFPLSLYSSSPSGRSMAAHIADANNVALLQKLMDEGFFEILSSTVLKVDCTGWHALDVALRNRNSELCEMLFGAVLRLPPRSRQPMVWAPFGMLPALVVLCRLYPSVACRRITESSLDPYGTIRSDRKRCVRRVPVTALQLDHKRMNIIGSETPDESKQTWKQLSGAGATASAKSAAVRRRSSVAKDDLHLSDGAFIGVDEVPCECGVVGIPMLMTKDRLIFSTFVEVSAQEMDFITCDAMRAAIEYKWKAYGHRRWAFDLVFLAFFFLFYFVSVYLLVRRVQDRKEKSAPSNALSEDLEVFGQPLQVLVARSLFLVAFAMNLRFGYLEAREYIRSTLTNREFFCAKSNFFDMALVINMCLLLPLLFMESSYCLAPAILCVLLMLPKLATVARGHEGAAGLIAVVGQVARDMQPFLGLLVVTMLSNAFACELLSPPGGQYDGAWNSWLATYTLALGYIEYEAYLQTGIWMLLIFHAFTLFVNIILFNIIISLVAETYDRVRSKRYAACLLLRAQLLMELEDRMTPAELDNPAFFPEWLHVVLRQGERGDVVEAPWAQNMRMEINSSIVASEERLVKRLADDGHRIAQLEDTLEGMGEKLETLLQNVDHLLVAGGLVRKLHRQPSSSSLADAAEVLKAELNAEATEQACVQSPSDERWQPEEPEARPQRVRYGSPTRMMAKLTKNLSFERGPKVRASFCGRASLLPSAAPQEPLTAKEDGDDGDVAVKFKSDAIRVFGSMRFGKDNVHKHEAFALKKELAKHGIDLYIAKPDSGGDITIEVFEAMSGCEAFIAFATSTYAEDTGNPASTYKELNYWQTRMERLYPNRLIPIKMLRDGENFDLTKKGVVAADVLFNSNVAYELWPVGSTRQADGTTKVPAKILDNIIAAVAGRKRGAAKSAAFSLLPRMRRWSTHAPTDVTSAPLRDSMRRISHTGDDDWEA